MTPVRTPSVSLIITLTSISARCGYYLDAEQATATDVYHEEGYQLPSDLTYLLIVLGMLAAGALHHLLIWFDCPVVRSMIGWFTQHADQRDIDLKTRFLRPLAVTQEIPVIRDGSRNDDQVHSGTS
jgi:hypothetical protein